MICCACKRSAKAQAAKTHPPMTTPSDDSGQGRHVLIVDDDPSIRALVKLIFERADFIVDSAVDGQEALDKLAGDTHYNVVILDLTMPKRSGFEVIEALKREPPEGLKGVVVMTACSHTPSFQALHIPESRNQVEASRST